ncbi:MAG: lasso peptide biosynthesis B2 protein [Anaerolineae bacterium]|nr:lasso peptide biosynthesis B2 protein [Gemmatimonadaceae bacterium]
MIARWRERSRALAAALVLPVLLRFASLPAVLALCDRSSGVGAARASPQALGCRVRRWLAYGYGPWKSSCLTRSLVLYAMLRQHGYRPHFLVGVSGPERSFIAHAWITLDGTPVSDTPAVIGGYRRLMSHHA